MSRVSGVTPPRVFALTELTLPVAIVMSLLGRPPLVVSIGAVFRPLSRIMVRIAPALMRIFGMRRAEDVVPEIVEDRRRFVAIRRGDYLPHERWMVDHLDHARLEEIDEDDRRPGRHESLKFMYAGITLIQDLHRLGQALGPFEIWGIDADIFAYYRRIHPDGLARARMTVPRGHMLNLPQAVLIVFVGLFKIVRWLRPFSAAPRRVSLGVDFVVGGFQARHTYIVYQLVDSPQDILWILRAENHAESARILLPSGQWRLIGQTGAMSLRIAAQSAAELCRKVFGLWWRFGDKTPELALLLMMIPLRRLDWRALFGVFRFRHFFGRDDYNVDHILRTQECRRVGTVSVGIAHGIMALNIVEPMVRHTDFDLFYAYGRDIYEKYNRGHWSDRMIVRDVGSWGMNREQIARLPLPRPNDILFFVTPYIDSLEFLRVGFAIARAFPDRKILVKLKPGSTDALDYPAIARMLTEGAPSNVVWTQEDTYELFLWARYAFGGLSTTVAEAIQYGLASFFLDMDDVANLVHYRAYPQMCVRTAAEAIERIRDIEEGRWVYPRESFAGLIDLSGRVVFDVMRADLGMDSTATLYPRSAVTVAENRHALEFRSADAAVFRDGAAPFAGTGRHDGASS